MSMDAYTPSLMLSVMSAGEEVLAFLFSLAAQRHHGDIKGCVIDQQMTEFAVVDNYVDSLARSSSKTQKFAC